MSAECKKAVEKRSMTMARKHYEREGYHVEDTSANRPYDFECTKRGKVVRVEVKGTIGNGASVLVTAG